MASFLCKSITIQESAGLQELSKEKMTELRYTFSV